MSTKEKLKKKFLYSARDFKWSELVRLLNLLGFQQVERSGSRVDFVKGGRVIKLHRPHPQKEVKAYVLKQVKETLRNEDLL